MAGNDSANMGGATRREILTRRSSEIKDFAAPIAELLFPARSLLVISLAVVFCGCAPSKMMRGDSISPDGKLVAVEFGNDETSFIYTVAVDTGNASRLTDAKDGSEECPSFSPDGKRIAFTYFPASKEPSRVVIEHVDGSGRDTWKPSSPSVSCPVFAPDNQTIVFGTAGYFGSYSPIAQPHAHEWNYFASNLDGTNLRQITHENFYSGSAASASPDSSSIVIATDDPPKISAYSISGKLVLAMQPHVPNEPDRPIFDDPSYMPDGKSVLFLAASNGKRRFDYDVYRVDLEGRAIERLTTGNGYATDLRVSADGKTAVFLKWRLGWRGQSEGNEIYLLDVESHRLRLLKVNGLR
jgi:Tol biopolymer transport system component